MSSLIVLGLGKSGVSAARHALANGDELTIYAGVANDATRAAALEFEQAGITVIFDSEDVMGSYDLCVASPGISEHSAFYASAAAASTEIMSEPEYAWRLSPKRWIAITGTNGKTTTTSLITHLLNAGNIPARSCGNIGTTCTQAVCERGAEETLVCEMSSYQLASTRKFAPDVAVLLNITPDHLSWHGGFEAYAAAKFKMFDNMPSGSTAVIGESVLAAYPELASKLAARGISLACVGGVLERSCAFEDADGMLVYVKEDGTRVDLVPVSELKIKGSHNVENALSASVAALAYGCPIEGVRAGLKSFSPLEHRIEPCGSIDGVEFFNDSKATNVDATLKALTAFPGRDVVLLLGGRDKGTELAELVCACASTCCAIIAYGEAGQRFYDAFESGSCERYLETGMRSAFERALSIATCGQAVLLSPACASFDEFNSFEQRGEVFKEYVAQAMGE